VRLAGPLGNLGWRGKGVELGLREKKRGGKKNWAGGRLGRGLERKGRGERRESWRFLFFSNLLKFIFQTFEVDLFFFKL
jgi:hypothetical protein